MERTGSGPPLVAARSLNTLPGSGRCTSKAAELDRATEVPFFFFLPLQSNQASTRRAYDV